MVKDCGGGGMVGRIQSMWVRKSQSEIEAFEKGRKRFRPRLNPKMPIALGIAGGIIAAAFAAACRGYRSPIPHARPLNVMFSDGFWSGVITFLGFTCFAYVMQLIFGLYFGERYRWCPICHKTDKPLCKCCVPWEPMDWWDWVADPQDAAADNGGGADSGKKSSH
jgi:hypothetical protein